MPKEKNTPIGEMQCAFRGCECMAPVYRYRERSDDETKRRFAGRVYACCERKHRCEDQDFILENAKIWGAAKSAGAVAAPAAVGPVKKPEISAKAPVTKAPVTKAPEPQRSAPVKVSASSSISPAPESEPKRSRPWGWFE